MFLPVRGYALTVKFADVVKSRLPTVRRYFPTRLYIGNEADDLVYTIREIQENGEVVAWGMYPDSETAAAVHKTSNVKTNYTFKWPAFRNRIKNNLGIGDEHTVGVTAYINYTVLQDGKFAYEEEGAEPAEEEEFLALYRQDMNNIHSNQKSFGYYEDIVTLLCARGPPNLTVLIARFSPERPMPVFREGHRAFRRRWSFFTAKTPEIDANDMLLHLSELLFLYVPLRQESDWVPLVQGLTAPMPLEIDKDTGRRNRPTAYLPWPSSYQQQPDVPDRAIYVSDGTFESVPQGIARGHAVAKAYFEGVPAPEEAIYIPPQLRHSVTILAKCDTCGRRATQVCSECDRRVCSNKHC